MVFAAATAMIMLGAVPLSGLPVEKNLMIEAGMTASIALTQPRLGER